jgi:hypothetical protein
MKVSFLVCYKRPAKRQQVLDDLGVVGTQDSDTFVYQGEVEDETTFMKIKNVAKLRYNGRVTIRKEGV